MAPQTEPKEWTLMFYFASDNPLAPEVVSQLKALKNAGYHPDVNVVAYFDPQTPGTPTHIFDVNGSEKMDDDKPRIGFGSDPDVRNLLFDRLWGEEKARDGQPIRKLIQELFVKPGSKYDLPELQDSPAKSNGRGRSSASSHNGDSASSRNGNSASSHNGNKRHSFKTDGGPAQSLRAFLDLCASEPKYKAKHYMLFILGHGLAVGDDVFLYDEHATRHSITLMDLRVVLDEFKGKISGAEFELVSFHSCSLSSMEVAFELQDTAKYMLASQGPAFVGSWPYTQILMRVFNDVDKGRLSTLKDVEKMLRKIFDYVMAYSADFMMAGYSFDLSLCDLSPGRAAAIEGPLRNLSKELIDALDDKMVTGCILLAHVRSQSYWKENYTDLFDFCYCLRYYCEAFSDAVIDASPYEEIKGVCQAVIDAFPDSPVIRAKFAGPESQYSHGSSIFFPWTRPTEDKAIMKQYRKYKFKGTDWHKFLNKYWGPSKFNKPVTGSMRDSIETEEADDREKAKRNGLITERSMPRSAKQMENDLRRRRRDDLVADMFSLMFNTDEPLDTDRALADGEKVNPPDRTGDSGTCGSIKNYRYDTRPRFRREESVNPAFQSSLDVVSRKG